jgi:RimJ/RimL family protein N-acetyltransferase
VSELYGGAGDKREAWFTVYETDGWKPIGVTWLSDIDARHGTAELSIFIGEAERRGRGLGTEAVRLTLEYAFRALGLYSVMLVVLEFNSPARRAYERAGFRQFGFRKGSYVWNGRRWDDVYMECPAEGWESPTSARGLRPPEGGAPE